MSAVSSSNGQGDAKAMRRTVVRLQSRLVALGDRDRRNKLKRAVADQIFWGLLLACALLLLGHFVRVLYHPVLVSVTVLLCGAIVALRARGRRRAVPELALWVDVRGDLDERISSALAFVAEPDATPMMRQAVIDAEAKLERLDEERVVEPEPSRRWIAAPLLLALLPALAFVPPRPTAAERRAAVVQQGIRAAGSQLVESAEALEEHLSPDATASARTAVEQTKGVGQSLESGEAGTREEGLERVQEARRRIDQALHEDRQRELLGERLRRSAATRAAGDALAAGDTQRAASELRELAASLDDAAVGGQAGTELAETLRDAGQAVPHAEAQAAANRAAAGAEHGRADAARDGLNDLAEQVEQMQSLGDDRAVVQDARQALQEARDRIGVAGEGQDAAGAGQEGADGLREPGAPDQGARPGAGQQPGESGENGLAGSSEAAEGQTPGAAGGREQGGGTRGADEGARGGAGDATPELGESVDISQLESGVRVSLAGKLLEGDRRAGDRSGGPRVQDDGAADMENVVRQFREVGEAEIARQEIPPGYRSLVRDYFTALEDVASGQAGQTAAEE